MWAESKEAVEYTNMLLTVMGLTCHAIKDVLSTIQSLSKETNLEWRGRFQLELQQTNILGTDRIYNGMVIIQGYTICPAGL